MVLFVLHYLHVLVAHYLQFMVLFVLHFSHVRALGYLHFMVLNFISCAYLFSNLRCMGSSCFNLILSSTVCISWFYPFFIVYFVFALDYFRFMVLLVLHVLIVVVFLF